MPFIINQHVYAVFLGEAFDKIAVVFRNTPGKIPGYTRVGGAEALRAPRRVSFRPRLRGQGLAPGFSRGAQGQS